MGTVRKIPQQIMFPKKVKVAAYCRVRTKASEQLASLAAQEQYYEERIKWNQHWTFVGVYSDVGSGTSIRSRRGFNALISSCRRGKINVVLVKSGHRFACNTVNALETIRLLKRWKVNVYFEQEDIHTLYESSEFMLTLIEPKPKRRAGQKAKISSVDCGKLLRIQTPGIIREPAMGMPMMKLGILQLKRMRRRLSG